MRLLALVGVGKGLRVTKGNVASHGGADVGLVLREGVVRSV